MSNRLVLLLLCITSFSFVHGVQAFSPGKIYSVEEMVQVADRILLVRYLAGKPERRGYRIVTLHLFKVLEVIKGNSSTNFEYYQAGGVLGKDDERIEGLPRYTPGEESVLFMKIPKTPKSLTAPIGSMQGKFRVWRDKDGLIMTENPVLDHIMKVRSSNGAMSARTSTANSLRSQTTKRSLNELKRLIKP